MFAPHSPHRKKVTANAQHARATPTDVKETVEKVEKASFNWAKLIARIYEVDPLICFVAHSSQIWRILKGIGWPTDIPEFDPEYEIVIWNICQLIPGTEDGFPEFDSERHFEAGPDPPSHDCMDSSSWEDNSDPPHWEE